MSKLANRIRTGHRTGQEVMGPIARRANGNGNGNGGCGPAPMTTPNSWGAACPPGFCTSDQLAANLNRQFAGERYGCRELPYWTRATAVGGIVDVSTNSRVTICPTRIMMTVEDEDTLLPGAVLTVFEIGNQNQIVGDGIPCVQLVPTAYQPIPFVTDCLKSGLPFRFRIVGLGATQVVYFAMIGPAIG